MELSYKCLRVAILLVIGGVWVSAADSLIDEFTSVTSRAIQECVDRDNSTMDLSDCLKSKALRVMDRVLKAGPLSIGHNVKLVKKPAARGARTLPPIDEATSPDALDNLLAGRAERLLDTTSLQVPLASLLGMDQTSGVTGRGKMKKMAGPAILIIAMAAYKLAMLMAGIAMLSGKALIVSKVALTLAGVAILKKLLSNGEGHVKTTLEIVKTPQVSHSHTYSSHHDDYGHHDKSWTDTTPNNHRSAVYGGVPHDPMDYPTGPAESLESMAPVYPNRRSFRMPPTDPRPSTIDSVRISGRTPLRVVLASPALLEDEPPMSEEYSQFGVPDTGAWRGLGTNGSASAEYAERAGFVQPTNTDYHPRSV